MTKFPNHRIVFMKDHVGNINDLITVEDMSSFDEKDFFFTTIEEAIEYQKEYQKKSQKKYPNKIVIMDSIFDKEIYDYFIENDGKVLADDEPWWSGKEDVMFSEWSVLFVDEIDGVIHCKVLLNGDASRARKKRFDTILNIETLREFLNDRYYKEHMVIDNDYPDEIKEYVKKPYDTEFPMHRVKFEKNGSGEIISTLITSIKGREELYSTIEEACEYINQHPNETITGDYEDDYVVDYLESNGVKYVGTRFSRLKHCD